MNAAINTFSGLLRGKFMSLVTINLPEEVFSARRLNPEEFVQDMRLAAAIYWYQKQEISMEKAATVAGLNRRDFLAVLAREQVDVFAVDFDDLHSELNRDIRHRYYCQTTRGNTCCTSSFRTIAPVWDVFI